MAVPFLDLQRINQDYRSQLDDQWAQFLQSGWYIMGEQLRAFEREWAAYCGTSYAVGVGNGLDALTLIFRGYIQLGRLKKGDKVIVPANTYIASILAILEAGLQPVLVEPNPKTFNLDSAQFTAAHAQCQAVLVVHLYGQLADLPALKAWCLAHDALLIEDAAQAHGAYAHYNGQNIKAGAWGDAAGFSFYPGKNLGALGDAGAITTSDQALYNTVAQLRNYGSEQKYHNAIRGVNSRLDEWQAAVLRVKLPDLDAQNTARQQWAALYRERITNPKIQLPAVEQSEGAHVYHLFVVLTENRKAFQTYLRSHEIQTLIHYPIPPHQQPALAEWGNYHFPITEEIHRNCVSLPLFPGMTQDEILEVIRVINAY